MRSEEDFDRRQSLDATRISKSYESAVEKRTDHGLDYIGHMSKAQRDKHQEPIEDNGNEAAYYQREAQRYTDVRRLAQLLLLLLVSSTYFSQACNTRWRNKWQSELDQYYPREDD